MTRTLFGAAAVAGLAAGSLAGASASFAASQAAARPAASNQRLSVLPGNDVGLNPTQVLHWQCYLLLQGYDPGPLDGRLDSSTWKAAQRMFAAAGWHKGPIDGIFGPGMIAALQRFLISVGYDLTADGILGPTTRAAFADFNSTDWCADL